MIIVMIVRADDEMVSDRRFLGSDSETLMYQLGLNHQLSSNFKVGLGFGSRDSKTQTQYHQNHRFIQYQPIRILS